MADYRENARHRIFCLIGKSGTGKDTLYRELLNDGALPLERLVPCTTRPIRAGEQDGREYHFYTVEELRALEQAGKVIESRCYETVHGPWYYFTADDGQIDLARRSTLLIGTLVSYRALRDYFGADRVVPPLTASAPSASQNIERCAAASWPTARTSPRRRSRRPAFRGGFRMMIWTAAKKRSSSICRKCCEPRQEGAVEPRARKAGAGRSDAEIFGHNRPEGHHRASA